MGGRKVQIWENNLKTSEKFNIFVFLTEFGDLRKGVISQEYVTEGILLSQEQFWKYAPLKHAELHFCRF